MNAQLPTLEPGVTYLADEDAPGALYPIVGRHLASAAGPAYWIDARNAAVPEAIRRGAPGGSARSLQVARAFTGFQHYELVRSLPGEVAPDTALVVAPNVAALYAEDDVPEHEAAVLFESTLELLAGVADAVDAPVLLTAGTARERIREAADRTIAAEETRSGLRVEGPSFSTDVYWHDWGFQTTIPYWVDLLGPARTARADPALDPVPLGV